MPKPFELTLRLRNNILKRMRSDLGMTIERMAEAIGISPGLYCACESLRWAPVGPRGWKPAALRISRFVGLPPEQVWPCELLAVTNPVLVREMDASELMPMLGSQQHGIAIAELPAAPDEMIDRRQVLRRLQSHIERLSEVEAGVFQARAIDNTPFGQIGKRWGFTRSRAQQIYCQTLDKIRSTCRHDPELNSMLKEK